MKITAIDIEYEIENKIQTTIELDLNCSVKNIDKNFEELTDFKKNDLINKPYLNIKHPGMPITVFKIMLEDIKQGKTVKTIAKNIRKGGRYYWTYNINEPIKKNKKVQGIKITQYPISSETVTKIENIYNLILEKELNAYIKKPEQIMEKIKKENNIEDLQQIVEEVFKENETKPKKGIMGLFQKILKIKP